MLFDKIKGQDKAISILRRAIEQDKIAQSYLFHGPEGVGKFTTALYFGMAINCHAAHEMRPCGVCPSCRKFLSYTHPDFLFIFATPNLDITPEGEIKSDKFREEYKAYIQNKIESPWKEFFFSKNIEIRIDSIRMLIHRINLTPNEGNKKIYIIENADMMNIKTANAFLKTLEEPPADTVIILTTSKPNSLLPTILSRCQQIPFQPVSRSLIETELNEEKYLENFEAKMYARIANGNMEKALRLADDGKIESRDSTIEFLQILLSQNDFHFLEFVNKYKTSKTQTILKEIISQLIIWMSDISFFKNCPSEIVNLDKTEILEKLFERNPNVDEYAVDLIEYLEQMQWKLEGHVNPQLILTGIYNKLSQTFLN